MSLPYFLSPRVIHLCVMHSPNAPLSHSAVLVGRSGKDLSVARVTKASLSRIEALSYANKVDVKLGLWAHFIHLHIRPTR